MKLSKVIALKGTLLGAMALQMLMIPAYGQQEVDPTWYNPWAATSKAAAQFTQAKSAEYKSQRTASAERLKSKKQARAKVPRHIEQTQATLGSK
jgi:hypothetical protein